MLRRNAIVCTSFSVKHCWFGNDFLDMALKAQATRGEKTDKLDFDKLKIFEQMKLSKEWLTGNWMDERRYLQIW